MAMAPPTSSSPSTTAWSPPARLRSHRPGSGGRDGGARRAPGGFGFALILWAASLVWHVMNRRGLMRAPTPDPPLI